MTERLVVTPISFPTGDLAPLPPTLCRFLGPDSSGYKLAKFPARHRFRAAGVFTTAIASAGFECSRTTFRQQWFKSGDQGPHF